MESLNSELSKKHCQSGGSSRSTLALSFEGIFVEFQPLVYHLGLKFSESPEDAEDIVQEVFTKIWRNLDSFNHDSSLKTWIYRIASNTCIDHSRRASCRFDDGTIETADALSSDGEELHACYNYTAENELLAEEAAAQIRKAITHLKPSLKEVLLLKEFEGMTYDEISSALGISLGTISSRLNRAKKALQEYFEAYASSAVSPQYA